LPKVPACLQCNGEKARLEHYLATVLPFGGRHQDATANLQDQAPRRLAENARLHRQLAEGRETIEIDLGGEVSETATVTIPLDGEKLLRYCEFVVKGLLWHHWEVILKAGFGVRVIAPTSAVAPQLVGMLTRNPRQHIKGDLGSGTFVYEGAQGNDYPEMSVWVISFYGGIVLSEHSHNPDEQSTLIYAVTARDEFLERPGLVSVFGDSRSNTRSAEHP
jgi:hypothetical protein